MKGEKGKLYSFELANMTKCKFVKCTKEATNKNLKLPLCGKHTQFLSTKTRKVK